MVKKRPKIPFESKVRAELQKEINSKCPFCPSTDVGHFEIHHIDNNPANNDIKNLFLLCPTCHSKITKGDIAYERVVSKKIRLADNYSSTDFSHIFISKEVFQSELKKLIAQPDSIYYTELKEHSGCSSLINSCPFLSQLINKNLPKSIEYGLLPLISDIVENHLYYDQGAKYIYNQPHVYPHNREDEGYNLPVFYHIRLIGILYATAIHNRIDIDTVAHHYKNMQTIYSNIVKGLVENLNLSDEIDYNREYPSNYHWLIGEIFDTVNNWLSEFNEKKYFVKKSSYLDFIPFNIRLCISELYDGVKKQKISQKFLFRQIYYGVLTEYFSPLTNTFFKSSIEKNIIAEIPDEYIEPLLRFSFDEKFAMSYEEFCEGRFRVVNSKEREILQRLRQFLIEQNKI